MSLALTVLAVISLAAYFLPFIVALLTDSKHCVGIFITNLLTGWTTIGWIACLIWAFVS